nr:peptidoglycan-binding protein [Ilumatobacteraceae bacterium]
MRLRSTSLRRPVALLLAGALVLAACSDDDDEPDATDAPAETEATEAPSDTQAISTEPPPPAGEPFVFGFMQPAPGLLRDLSTAQLTSIQFAVDDINAAGGVNGGEASLLVAEEPPGGDPSDAVRELVEGGANVILGPVGSTAALGILPALAETGTVACSASATLATLDQADTENRLFRTAISDAYTVGVLAQQIQTLRETEVGADAPYKVTIVARNDDYGVGVGNGLALTLTTAGITTEVISYNPRRVIFGSEAAQAAASGANLVLMVSYAESARLLTSLLEAGVDPATIGGIEGAFDPRLAEAASPSDPSAADGVRVFGVTGDRAFIDRLVAAPDTTEILYGAQAYDCAIVTALAATVAGSGAADTYSAEMIGVTRDGRGCSTYADCIASVEAGDDIDYIGVTGGIAFDEFGSATQARFTVAQFTGGALEEVSSEEFDLADLQRLEFLQTAIFNTRLQQFLTVTGFYSGPINGLPSEEFTNAIIAFQVSVGVEPTGVWDEATDAAAREKYGALYALVGDSIAGLQQLLTDLGYYTGPIDGTYNAEFVAAIKALQADLGVPQTGIFDAATLQAIFNAGLATGTPPSTTAPPETTA